jgi:hypothetical protein
VVEEGEYKKSPDLLYTTSKWSISYAASTRQTSLRELGVYLAHAGRLKLTLAWIFNIRTIFHYLILIH